MLRQPVRQTAVVVAGQVAPAVAAHRAPMPANLPAPRQPALHRAAHKVLRLPPVAPMSWPVVDAAAVAVLAACPLSPAVAVAAAVAVVGVVAVAAAVLAAVLAGAAAPWSNLVPIW